MTDGSRTFVFVKENHQEQHMEANMITEKLLCCFGNKTVLNQIHLTSIKEEIFGF